MKKLIGVIAMLFLLSMSWTACNNESKQHVEDAKENLGEATENMKEATNEVASDAKTKAEADWIAFKTEADQQLQSLEDDIDAREAKIAGESKTVKEKMKAQIAKDKENLKEMKAELKQKNDEFNDDMKDFNEDVAMKSEEFKKEFKSDMNRLGDAIKGLFQKDE